LGGGCRKRHKAAPDIRRDYGICRKTRGINPVAYAQRQADGEIAARHCAGARAGTGDLDVAQTFREAFGSNLNRRAGYDALAGLGVSGANSGQQNDGET
jgi:hypothetical protein